MYEQIKQQIPELDQLEHQNENEQMRILIGSGIIIKDKNKQLQIQKVVVDYIRQANEKRKTYIK